MTIKFGRRLKNVVAVDIGSYAVKVAGLRRNPAELEFYAIIDIPGKDSQQIAAAIQKVLKDNNVHQPEISLSISDESVNIRRIELPLMPQSEILGALKWQAKERIPYDIESAVTDFRILKESARPDGSKGLDLIFASILEKPLSGLLSSFAKASIGVRAVNVSPFAIENIVKISDATAASKTVMVIDMGHKKTDILFFNNSVLQFVRTVPIASSHITNALCAPIAAESGEIRYTPEEAEDIKREIGISYEELTGLRKNATSVQLLVLMRGVLERLAKEAKRSIDYYVSEAGGNNVEAAFLAGGGSRLKNIDRYLSEELGMPVALMDLPKTINISNARLKDGDALSILAAIGAGLNYSNKVNLLPNEYKLKKRKTIENISIRMVSFVILACLVLSYLFLKFGIEDFSRRTKVSSMHRQILSQVKALNDKIRERSVLIEAAQAAEVPVESIMREISMLIPRNAALESLAISAPAKSMDMRGIIFAGPGAAESDLTKFMEEMEKSGFFKDAQLGSFQLTTVDKKSGYRFSIACLLETCDDYQGL